MNDLIDRFFDLPPGRRALVAVVIVCAVFGAYAFLLYLPRNQQIADKEEGMAELQADRDRKAALVADLSQARQEAADLGASLNLAVAQLPDTKEIPDLLSNISGAARQAGLEIQFFKEKPEVYQDFYAEVPTEIMVRGAYWQVESFLERVSNLTRIVNVGEIVIKAPTLIESDPVKLQTSCAATTFRFLDEQERARIAKEKELKEGKK